MTVKELIEKLNVYPEDAEVFIRDRDGDWDNAGLITIDSFGEVTIE